MRKQGKNKYYNRSHISEKKFRELVRCFANDFNALEASKITHISHRSCKIIYAKLRSHIARFCMDNRPAMGEFELDEMVLREYEEKEVVELQGRHLYLVFLSAMDKCMLKW